MRGGNSMRIYSKYMRSIARLSYHGLQLTGQIEIEQRSDYDYKLIVYVKKYGYLTLNSPKPDHVFNHSLHNSSHQYYAYPDKLLVCDDEYTRNVLNEFESFVETHLQTAINGFLSINEVNKSKFEEIKQLQG